MCSMSDWNDERLARAVLSQVCEPGDPRLTRLISGHGAADALAALRRSGHDSAWVRRARTADASALVDRAERLRLRYLMPSDAEWPAGLADLDRCEEIGGMGGAPLGLWVLGTARLDQWLGNAVAIVGARAATRYGEVVATELAGQLSAGRYDYTVVSGGAFGIDASAHKGALTVGGRTIGVYAGGLHEPYPKQNARLFERLAVEQLVISEVAPGLPPTRAGFLARNRLIAALGLGCVVVEAAQRSGAQNTASWAAALGRAVMAVPGSVDSAMSVGCHRLIRDGQATLVADSNDVAALLAPIGRGPVLPSRGEQRPLDLLDPRLLAIREAMPGRRAASAGEVAIACGHPVPDVVAALIELEQLGMVRRTADGTWRLGRPAGA